MLIVRRAVGSYLGMSSPSRNEEGLKDQEFAAPTEMSESASANNLNSAEEASSLEWPLACEVVWVRKHETLPYWPANVIDPERIPTEIQASGRLRRGKKVLYMYASAHYDTAKVSQLKPYQKHREEFGEKQDIPVGTKLLFDTALGLADKDCLLQPEQRLAWVNARDGMGNTMIKQSSANSSSFSSHASSRSSTPTAASLSGIREASSLNSAEKHGAIGDFPLRTSEAHQL